MMIKKRHKKQAQLPKISQSKSEDVIQTFADHLLELRKRLFYVAGRVLFFSTVAYFVQQQLVHLLLTPAHNQHFIYTSPGGGITFLFEVCTYVGIAMSIPVFVYQLLRFIEPVMSDNRRQFVLKMGCSSVFLAAIGLIFGYAIGLPAALHFLGHQFTTNQITPLFTIQEYMSFVTVYLIGSALIFQLPLVILFINHIKPLKPNRLLHFERYVIAAAFIISMVMAPTVNIIDQLVLAGPIIVTYQVAILLVMLTNRKRNSRLAKLLAQDDAAQLKPQQAVADAVTVLNNTEFLPQYLHKEQVAVANQRPAARKRPATSFDIIRRPIAPPAPPRRTFIQVDFK
jgi:sec-independent protein translocase protein TatC